ncbi:hypothetical protein B6N60_04223 [Richelia sinica FACHB-800]|uniref:Uncharacterized protein n=1 Tax=Richelia sinica FACHB-800 TaxID=1357546 RepID=A0A975TCI9_9NOST|nr:hypothetical protein B6N60_04223 [Richelia sinica FACHB-800]
MLILQHSPGIVVFWAIVVGCSFPERFQLADFVRL